MTSLSPSSTGLVFFFVFKLGLVFLKGPYFVCIELKIVS